MMLLGADLGQLQRAPETFRGRAVVAKLLLQLADDGMEKMMALDQFAPRHFRQRIEAGLRSVDMGDGDGTVERDDG